MSNNHNFLALDWVKSEIEETLKQAQQALEAHISNPSDESQLRFCLAYLHQIFGTLQMVEFHGAAMLAEEMEKLCLSLVNGKVTDTRKAYDVLVKAMLHLPAYLERLQATKRDVPFVLLPIINTLRIAHDEIPLSEVSLFQPDFGRVYSIIGQDGETPSVEALKKLRHLYQSGLVGVMRDADPHAGIMQLRQSVQLLSRMLSSKPLKSLWSVADALLEGLEARSIPLSPAVKLLLGEIEREIRKFAAFPQHVPSEELLRNILYYIAKSQGKTAAIVETKALYRLDEALPSAEKIEADAQSLNAPDRSAVKSVVKSTSDELATIKETIDDLMYADRPEIRTLEPLLPALKQIAGTLTVMDWSDLQRIADEIHGVLSAAVRSGHLSEGTLLHVAAGILELEGGLQQLIDDQPLFESYAPSTTVADQLSAAQSAVLRESRTALEKAKEAIVEYISSQWDPERLAELPELINTVRGGLTMLDIVRPAQILSRLSEYIEKQLLTENYRPSWSEMDTMADVVSSVEYYLERVASHHQNNDLLELAERALQRLGFGLVLVMPETNPEELERAREQQAQRAQEVEKGPEEPHEIGDENTTLLNMPAIVISDPAPEESETAVVAESETEEALDTVSTAESLEVTGIHPALETGDMTNEEDADRTLISMPALQIDIIDESAPTEVVTASEAREDFDTDKTLIAMPALQIDLPGDAPSPVAEHPVVEEDMGRTLVSMPALQLPDDMAVSDKTREFPAVQPGQASPSLADDSDKTLISMPALVLPEDKPTSAFGAPEDFDSTLTFDAEALLDGVDFLGARKTPVVPVEASPVEASPVEAAADATIVSMPVIDIPEMKETESASHDSLVDEEFFDAEATMGSSEAAPDTEIAAADTSVQPASPEVVAEVPVQKPARAPRPVFAAMPNDDFDQDDEIREIFIEEVEEVLETIHEYFPKWAANFENKAALTEFRRGFHTLKGSGRMVGARVVGELAWSIENMLNRVIDHTAKPTPAMNSLIEAVIREVPGLVENFRDKAAPGIHTVPLMEVADQFAKGLSPAQEDIEQAIAFAHGDFGDETEAVTPAESFAEAGEDAMLDETVALEAPVALVAPDVEHVEVTVAQEDDQEAEMAVTEPEPEAIAPTEAASVNEAGKREPDDVTALSAPVLYVVPEDDFSQDDEIREIFIEEAEEVLETIHQHFPKWAANFENKQALTEFRRGFHTLKGSGRMVGAKVVGETAWAIENMLNRVIDHTARPSPAMCLLISSVLEMVPDLVRNFSEKQAPVYNPGYLMAVADEFSRGHAVPEEQVQRAVSFARDPSLADRIVAEQAHEQKVSDATFRELAAGDAENTLPAVGTAEPAEHEDLTDAFEALASSLEEIEPEAATGVEDPVLMDIFTSEANSYLEEIDRFLDDHAGAANVAVTDGVLRALHTLRGSAGMAGVRLVAAVAAPMETLFKDMRNQGRLLNVNHLGLLRETHRIIQQSISGLMQGGDGAADGEEELIARIDSVARMPVDHDEVAEAPAVVNTAGLVAGFLDLGLDELMDAPWELSNWLAADDRADHIETLMQELGKLVPAARESGIDPLSSISSALVAIYTQILADDSLLQNEALLEVIGDAHDEIINIFDTLAACQTVTPNARLSERLQQWYAPAAAIPVATAPAVVEYDDGADPELLSIFLEEGEEILEAADTEFRNWQAKPDDKNALRALQRHLHTLKGGARMAVVASLGDLAHELEFLYEGLVDGRYSASPVLVDLLQRCHDRLADMLTDLVRNGRCGFARDLVEAISLYRHSPKDSVILDFFSSAAVGSTKAAVTAAPEVAPVAVQPIPSAEPLPTGTAPIEAPVPASEAVADAGEVTRGFDPEMLEIFLEEAQEIVEETTRMLEEWMADPETLEPVRILQRGLHTLKGGARMAGVTALGDIAHEMENLYEAAGLGRLKITAPGLSLLQRCHDNIAVAVEDLQQKGECPGFSELVEALKRYLSNPSAYEDTVRVQTPKAAPAPTVTAPVQVAATTPALTLTPVDLAGIPSMMGNFRKAESAQQAAQEMIRVSSELMEKLINLAGESSIIRSRVEMGVHGFAQTVEEMGATVQRLADQLRRMQGELEAQIIAQHTDDSTKYADFDPLEMDQYSSVNQLSKSLYESASDLMDIKVTLIEKARDTETLLLQQSRLNTELQEGLMSSRMVPFSRLVPRLQRIVRQTSQELHKPAELHVINAEGEMDRTLLERLVAPLEHMLRNAVDHGLESPEERAASGKESMGRVSLSISREGGEVVLHLTDDGKGINVDAVRKKALERGLIEEGQTISDRELLQFIFHAGFSTAQKVTQISGRGVGMDVVQSEIKQLGGVVSIQSERGKGTTFVLRLPFTVAVSRALMVRIGEDVYAIPLSQIEGIVRASPYELETYYSPDAPPFEYAGLSYKLHYLGEFVHGVRTPSLFGQTLPLPILLVRGGEQRVSIQVDQLIGSREIVVKSVGAQLASVAGISGATILGDGSVVIILDVVAMLRAAAIQRPRVKTAEKGPETAAIPEKTTKTVMVVDDSVTVRKVTSRLLERHGYDVVLAKDGLDAISKLEEIRPDIMLLDIEMPRMDGFEVASLVRHNPNLTGLPIIMITSRTGEKHRERAFQIGVNCYMGKPFQEQQLLDTIGELLAAPVAR